MIIKIVVALLRFFSLFRSLLLKLDSFHADHGVHNLTKNI